jgi:hypothetical protein
MEGFCCCKVKKEEEEEEMLEKMNQGLEERGKGLTSNGCGRKTRHLRYLYQGLGRSQHRLRLPCSSPMYKEKNIKRVCVLVKTFLSTIHLQIFKLTL